MNFLNNYPITKIDIDTLARTMYGEARGEIYHPLGGLKSLSAIAEVVKNRLLRSQWPNTIHAVCKQPWQFSCWNKNDPNLQHLMALDNKSYFYQICENLGFDVLSNPISNITKGADHYHANYIAKLPSWTINQQPTISIGHHIFYRLCLA